MFSYDFGFAHWIPHLGPPTNGSIYKTRPEAVCQGRTPNFVGFSTSRLLADSRNPSGCVRSLTNCRGSHLVCKGSTQITSGGRSQRHGAKAQSGQANGRSARWPQCESVRAKDFRRYVGQSGDEGGINVTCSQVGSGDAAKNKADEMRKQGHEVVEAKWSYAGG